MHTISITELLILLLLLITMMVVCIKTGKLSFPAALAAGLTGVLVFAGAGYTGIALLGAFFVMGVVATAHKKALKAKITSDGRHPEKRKASQVFANGGVAAITALLAIADPGHKAVYTVMLAASLAAAAADTLSSELGMVYGSNCFNILTFKKEPKGLDGVISIEGTLMGAAGALVIAIIYAFANGFNRNGVFILLAGIIGNFVDSILGASLERKHYIGNDVVNFLNTLFAALVAWVFYISYFR
ncbi:uncharacterized protein (TIGR00297 family) [Chitinophaga niastensis]|uniref:Uncharacterized protein (TIGR00297 family) n=1 Tax=Chitinophaga niastensis TaxID=536980 RepID=A0A2P8H9L9_CHINA|nr:DUF92 domain-containing protein [Chitinophaga niastensis]PSL42891.1 uncharacterized protein (TIGR00297 family) [Chitinophaga niastensis]